MKALYANKSMVVKSACNCMECQLKRTRGLAAQEYVAKRKLENDDKDSADNTSHLAG